MFPQFSRVGSFEIAFGALANFLLLARSRAEKPENNVLWFFTL
jgi:hypothetical protein